MKYEYKINDREKMIYQFYKGKLSIYDLESALLKLTDDSSFDPDYNILTDLRECKIEFRPEDLEQFVRVFKDKFGRNRGKSAILLDTPYETAISTIHQSMTSDIRRIQLFSTYEAAMNWLRTAL